MYSKPFERQPEIVDMTTTRTDLSFQNRLILARLNNAETANFREKPTAIGNGAPNIINLFDGYQVFVHDNLDDVAERWAAFQTNAQGYAYQRLEWAVSWIETVGKPQDYKVHIVEIRDSLGETAMIVPLCWQQSRFANVAYFLGEDMFDYLGPLVRQGFLTELSKDQQAELWDVVTRSFPVDIDLFWLDRLPIDLARSFVTFKPFALQQMDNRAHALDIPNAPDWSSAARQVRSKKTIKKLERRMRGLAKLGELKLIEVTGKTARHQHLEDLIELKVSNLNDAGVLHRFDRADIRAFYVELVNNTERDEDLLQFELRCDDELVASVMGMSHQGTFYYQVCAHNRSFAKFSPGLILMYQLMSWSFDRGLECFDMTVGDEAYKMDWINRSTALTIVSWPRTLVGKLVLTKRTLVSRTKQLVRSSSLLTRLAMALLAK